MAAPQILVNVNVMDTIGGRRVVGSPTTLVGRNFESFLLDPLGLYLHHYLPLLLQGCPSSSWPATSSSSSSNAKSASGSIGGVDLAHRWGASHT